MNKLSHDSMDWNDERETEIVLDNQEVSNVE
jgi:hypothetical protein